MLQPDLKFIILDYFCAMITDLSSFNRDCVACEDEAINYWALFRRSLVSSGLDDHSEFADKRTSIWMFTMLIMILE